MGGYTVMNDVSVRDWQGRSSEWFQGKNWDAMTPFGPVIVSPDEVARLPAWSWSVRWMAWCVSAARRRIWCSPGAAAVLYFAVYDPGAG